MARPFLLPSLIAALLWTLLAFAATAHEFWIEPTKWQVETGATMTADLRNGETFEGAQLTYFPTNFTRFEVYVDGARTPVEGRMGDRPALAMPAPAEGLAVIVYETTPSSLTYKTWDKFQAFADHKDFPDIRARHDAAGFPTENFTETYTRHAKALIAIGDGSGADLTVGLATEFTALTNPYAPGFDGTMRIRLDYEGGPRADAQVEIFDRAPGGTVMVSYARTDAQGVAEIPVLRGHDYLFDAVVLRPASGETNAVWETLWAALTFHVPD